jgi:hypothetical protein
MKTYRQKLSIWIDSQIESNENPEIIMILDEIKDKIKKMEKEEEHMVNCSYDSGFNDANRNRGRISNYYREKYKSHDVLKDIVKNRYVK